MRTEQGGKRVKTLQQVLLFVATTYSFVRPEGLNAVRYLNTKTWNDDVHPRKLKALFNKMYYHGSSRIGTELKRKVLDIYVKKDMPKPLLVIVITDGEVGHLLFDRKKVITWLTSGTRCFPGRCG